MNLAANSLPVTFPNNINRLDCTMRTVTVYCDEGPEFLIELETNPCCITTRRSASVPIAMVPRHCVLVPVICTLQLEPSRLSRITARRWLSDAAPYPRTARMQDTFWVSYFNCCVSRFSSATGHYTQVVWADTYLVGCGFTAFNNSDGWYRKFYACNYGPGGNYLNGIMYKTGTACSQCPAGTICDNGLCA
jgi:hypothetical protein